MARPRIAVGLAAAFLVAACSGSGVPATTSLGSGEQTSTTVSIDDGSTADGFRSAEIGRSVANVSLPDASNGDEPFVLVPTEGHVLAVYFGYTSCPDVCPTTMADLRAAITDLGPDGESVEVAMVTVDPGRDSGQTITDYVQYFIPGAHALRTEDQAALKEAADAFGADFGVVNLPNGRTSAFHTPYLYAVDDSGTIQAVWQFGASPDAIAADLSRILNG